MDNQIEDDDWNPNINTATVFDKVVLDMRDHKIKENIAKLEELEEEAVKEYKDLTVRDILEQGNKGENMDKEDKENEQNEENIMFDLKDQIKNQKLFGENLYDPIKDDKYDDWVRKNLRKDPSSCLVLNCPYCFTQVCYDAQRHEVYENQYRAIFVRNCKVDCTKTLQPQNPDAKNNSQKVKTFLERMNEQEIKRKEKRKNELLKADIDLEDPVSDDDADDDDLEYEKEYEEIHPKSFEYFFPVLCKTCETEIGVYDLEGKVFHFFNVVPSLG